MLVQSRNMFGNICSGQTRSISQWVIISHVCIIMRSNSAEQLDSAEEGLKVDANAKGLMKSRSISKQIHSKNVVSFNCSRNGACKAG